MRHSIVDPSLLVQSLDFGSLCLRRLFHYSHDDVLKALIGLNLLRNTVNCDKCDVNMRIVKRSQVNDGIQWICKKRAKVCSTKSIRCQSLFAKSNLSLSTLLMVCYMWAADYDNRHMCRELNLDKHTVVNWLNMCREVCENYCFNDKSIGGPSKVVEIDETCIAKRKYNRGRKQPGNSQWVFGGIERGGSGKAFAFRVPDRKKITLLKVIRKKVRRGTTIISDDSLLYVFTICHKRLFARNDIVSNGTSIRVHTNKVEGFWMLAKHKIKRIRGTRNELIASYIAEAVFRQHSKIEKVDPLEKIFEQDSKEIRAGELARLLGLDNNSSPVPTQTSPPSTTSRSENKDKSLYLADGWLRSLTASSPGIHLFFPQPQSLARDESNSVNEPASVTLAPPVVPPDLLPTPAPYTLPPLLSEYARPVTSTTASPSGRRSTHRPETYVRDLNDLGEDNDLANTIGGKDAGKGEEEDYEEQSEPCPSAPTTCASNSALGAATWLGGNAKDPNADENTEMCNSRRLSALIQDTIVAGDPEASKRAIQGRAEAEFGGFYNVVCGTGFYSYIAHTDEFCLASTNDINCYVFSPVCSLRLGFAAGIGRRRTSATGAASSSRQRRFRNNKRKHSSFQRLVNSKKYYSARRRKAFLNRN